MEEYELSCELGFNTQDQYTGARMNLPSIPRRLGLVPDESMNGLFLLLFIYTSSQARGSHENHASYVIDPHKNSEMHVLTQCSMSP